MSARAVHLLSLLLTLLLAAPRAGAQQQAPRLEPTPLALPGGVPLGPGRDLAMGGASVGLADGAGGIATNLAALAHRNPLLTRDWDVGVNLATFHVPFSSARGQDWDNDGAPDDAQRTLQLLAGVLLQFRTLGLGLSFRTDTTGYCLTAACGPEAQLEASVTRADLAAALALFGDSLLVAAGVHATDVTLRHAGREVRYGDSGPTVGLLWRPAGQPWRLGAAVRPPVHALPREGTLGEGLLAGRVLHAAVVAPATVSLGGSLQLGPGAQHYNRLSPVAQEEAGLVPPGPEARAEPGAPWLLALQLDVLLPRPQALPLRSLVGGPPAVALGRRALLLPRAGVEHQLWPGRLRARAGFFLETSPFVERPLRPHLTGGVELFVLRYLEDWALSASVDAAPGALLAGFSIGFWR